MYILYIYTYLYIHVYIQGGWGGDLSIASEAFRHACGERSAKSGCPNIASSNLVKTCCRRLPAQGGSVSATRERDTHTSHFERFLKPTLK